VVEVTSTVPWKRQLPPWGDCSAPARLILIEAASESRNLPGYDEEASPGRIDGQA
jgi:hypothetical protein